MAKTNSRGTRKTGSPQSVVKASSKNKNRKIKLGVFGAGGRMGQEVLAVIQETQGECFLAIDPARQALAAKNVVSDLKNPLCKEVDLWIDFSSPEGFSEIYQFCEKNRRALVSGTTGLSDAQLAEMGASKIPLLWSPNMSLGINILLRALNSFQGSQGFDFQIEEIHHRHKKDRPSGTALWLQSKLEKVTGKRIEKPLSIRGGGNFGTHKIWAMSDEENITFEHQALNRRVFAKGAVQAAGWLKNQKPGLYSLQNMLEQL